MTIEAEKAAQRRAAAAARAAGRSDAAETAAQAHLAAILHGEGPLAGYLPIRSEIDPRPVMARHGAVVGVPVIRGAAQPLVFHRWEQGCALVAGPFGAMVPETGVEMVPQVLIVPLLAFDAQGYRLGYGGGFYDRTLAALRASGAVRAVGFAFGVQEVAAVCRDQFDERLDAIVTEDGARIFG
jgi:5-formyltetrahydrofolate cyclo-ligase